MTHFYQYGKRAALSDFGILKGAETLPVNNTLKDALAAPEMPKPKAQFNAPLLDQVQTNWAEHSRNETFDHAQKMISPNAPASLR